MARSGALKAGKEGFGCWTAPSLALPPCTEPRRHALVIAPACEVCKFFCWEMTWRVGPARLLAQVALQAWRVGPLAAAADAQ